MNDDGLAGFFGKLHLCAEKAHLRFAVGKVIIIIKTDLAERNDFFMCELVFDDGHRIVKVARFSTFVRMDACGSIDAVVSPGELCTFRAVLHTGRNGENVADVGGKELV